MWKLSVKITNHINLVRKAYLPTDAKLAHQWGRRLHIMHHAPKNIQMFHHIPSRCYDFTHKPKNTVCPRDVCFTSDVVWNEMVITTPTAQAQSATVATKEGSAWGWRKGWWEPLLGAQGTALTHHFYSHSSEVTFAELRDWGYFPVKDLSILIHLFHLCTSEPHMTAWCFARRQE